MSRDAELLAGLSQTLDQIGQVLEMGRDRYARDPFIRLSLQRLWISVGNLAEQYRLAAGLADGAEPWTELYVYRGVLAHALPDELDDTRVWEESNADLGRIRAAVAAARN